MRIACPNCQARYEVPASLLAAGRPVRCARCGQDWLPEAEDEPQAAPRPGSAPPEFESPEPGSPEPQPAAPQPAVPVEEPRHAPPPPNGRGQRPLPTLFPPAADRNAARLSPAGRDPWPQRRDRGDWPVPPPREMPSRTGLAVAWIASLIAVAVLVWAAYAFRDNVAAAWPPSARVYSGLGIETVPPPPR